MARGPTVLTGISQRRAKAQHGPGTACWLALAPPRALPDSPFDSRNKKSQSDMWPYLPGPRPPFAAQYPSLSPSNCLTARQEADQNLSSAVTAAGWEARIAHCPRIQTSCLTILGMHGGGRVRRRSGGHSKTAPRVAHAMPASHVLLHQARTGTNHEHGLALCPRAGLQRTSASAPAQRRS